MSPPHPPDEPWVEDSVERLFRQISLRAGGNGNVSGSGTQTFANWSLGLFGGSIIVMLGFVLNAVYTTNGDLHEVKGQNSLLQAEVIAMRLEVTQLAERVAINDAGKRP